jgi:hypothetical protein
VSDIVAHTASSSLIPTAERPDTFTHGLPVGITDWIGRTAPGLCTASEAFRNESGEDICEGDCAGFGVGVLRVLFR